MPSAQTKGMIFVPVSFAAFHQEGIEPLIIALLRDSEALPVNALEALQEACGGQLEIFPSDKGNVIITFPFKGKVTPEQFRRLLLKHCEIKTLIRAVSPEELEGTAKEELCSSLHTD